MMNMINPIQERNLSALTEAEVKTLNWHDLENIAKRLKLVHKYSEGLKYMPAADWDIRLGWYEERLRTAVADVPKQLKRLALNYWFPGECFPRAIYFVRANPKLPTAEYILGEALAGGFGQHGWVEFEDLVFDGVLQEWYTKEGYYTLGSARPWYRFSRPATMYLARKMYKLDVFTFRWDWWLYLPWGKNTSISLEQAKAYYADAEKKRNQAATPSVVAATEGEGTPGAMPPR